MVWSAFAVVPPMNAPAANAITPTKVVVSFFIEVLPRVFVSGVT